MLMTSPGMISPVRQQQHEATEGDVEAGGRKHPRRSLYRISFRFAESVVVDETLGYARVVALARAKIPLSNQESARGH